LFIFQFQVKLLFIGTIYRKYERSQLRFMFSFLMIIAQQKTNQLFFEISPKFYQIITPV